MKLTIAQLDAFVTKWKKLRLTDEDLQALEALILENPTAGDVMSSTGGVRKIRFAPPSWNRGKERALPRVCYALFANIQTAYLVTLFTKNEMPNLSPEHKAVLKIWMQKNRARLND